MSEFFNLRWFITSGVAGLLLIYALPEEWMRVCTVILFIFLFVAGVAGLVAARVINTDSWKARQAGIVEAAQLFSAGVGVLVGGAVSLHWLIPALPYLH